MNRFIKVLIILVISLAAGTAQGTQLKALIITGQSNPYHNWKISSPMLKQFLEETGLFKVDTAINLPDSNTPFEPNFAAYNVVVLDYEGKDWPERTQQAFVDYVKSGGGVVVYHAADNAFPQWKEYNQIIGLGGWGNRDENWGPMVRWRDGKMVLDNTQGKAGTHPPAHDFQIVNRNPEHPVTKGLPERWMHAKDEIYSKLRGPAENLTILATAYCDPNVKSKWGSGTGENEPVLFTINYGKGRIFHTTLGHANKPPFTAIENVDFIVTFQSGAEWAATGNVTQKLPPDFPTATEIRTRKLFPDDPNSIFLKALIVTGQCTNPHDWKASSVILKQLLEETHLFKVDIAVSPPEGNDMSGFAPRFMDYNVVVLDYKGDDWPEQTKTDFVQYVKNGGGVVVYHGASWSFEGWDEYNKIIGLRYGGDEKLGPHIYWRDGQFVRDYSPGAAGEEIYPPVFPVDVRNRQHPIMAGLPEKWMHEKEGFYIQLRGPAENLTVLATAYADPNLPTLRTGKYGSGENEPVLFTVNYGKGRVFHTVLGHVYPKNRKRKVFAINSVDFIVTFQRGAEWAATGSVTQKVPADFPTATEVKRRPLNIQTTEVKH